MKKIAKRQKKGGDSWQIIYMDLMTNIMVFFVIIWSLSAAKDEGVSETVGDVTSRMINLPGDVLFGAGKTELSGGGKDILKKLFHNEDGPPVLDFGDDTLSKRLIVFHGHTDGDGKKMSNMQLGFKRAMSSYQEILKYNKDLQNHAVICTHADNSPEEDVPIFTGKLTAQQRETLKKLKGKNRRITIEDKTVNRFEEE